MSSGAGNNQRRSEDRQSSVLELAAVEHGFAHVGIDDGRARLQPTGLDHRTIRTEIVAFAGLMIGQGFDQLRAGGRCILAGGIRTIGRATGADFIVDAPLVSRVHCRVTALPTGELEVRDLNSTNGTFVNGDRVENAVLESGDRLQVGRVELVALRDAD